MRRAVQRRLSGRVPDSGFTLVELVVAMIIIAGVLMALIAVQISAAQAVVEARKRTQANAIANEAMEQLRATPWTYIQIGVDTRFNPGGQDPYVTGGTVRLPGSSTSDTLIKGTQDLSKPRPPLFDSSGSNVYQVTDAAVTNTLFTVRSYVIQPELGSVNTVGLAVVVSWKGSDDKTKEIVLESVAYRGTGCGDPDEAPYLSTCQATFEAIASSGTLITTVYATTTPDVDGNSTPVNLLYPSTDPYYTMSMRSASVGASARGQQVTTVMAGAQFGGTERNDNDDSTQPSSQGWVNGYAIKQVRASDDSSQTVIPAEVASTTLTQANNAENAFTLSTPSITDVEFISRSDYRRPVTAMASTKLTSCKTGIPADQPCSFIQMTNAASLEDGSGYILLRNGSAILRLSRRIAESAPPANDDQAWVARFTKVSTNSAVGCQTVSGAGCMSAGADRTMARLMIGGFAAGSWSQAAATSGLAVLEGRTACTGGFTESVMVQRGSSQRTTAPTTTRCGQIRYWNGTGYTTVSIDGNRLDPISTGTLTWGSGGYSITASAVIDATATNSIPDGADPYCADEPCSVRAETGTINILASYRITGPTFDYMVYSTTTIEGPNASVVYQEAPSAVS